MSSSSGPVDISRTSPTRGWIGRITRISIEAQYGDESTLATRSPEHASKSRAQSDVALTVAAGTASTVTASSINWSATGQNLANGLIVAVDSSRHIRVFAGGGGSTNFIIDVACYFL